MIRWQAVVALVLCVLGIPSPARADDGKRAIFLEAQTKTTRFELAHFTTASVFATCQRSCRVDVVPGTYRLRVLGSDATEDRVIELTVDRDVLVRAGTPDEALHRRGNRLFVTGLVAIALGAAVFVAGSSTDPTDPSPEDLSSDDDCSDWYGPPCAGDYPTYSWAEPESLMAFGSVLSVAGAVTATAGVIKARRGRGTAVRVYPFPVRRNASLAGGVAMTFSRAF